MMTRLKLNKLNYRKVLPGCTQYALLFSGVLTRKYGMVQNLLVPTDYATQMHLESKN
jgi:hypothetical protein